MKTRIALFLGLLLIANVSFAELKIGVVNMPTILKETPQTEKALKRLEQEFSPRKKQLDTQLNEIKSLDEKLSRDASVMSDAERGSLEKKVLNKKRDFERSTLTPAAMRNLASCSAESLRPFKLSLKSRRLISY